MKPIYLDYNATTPIAAEVAAAMGPYLDEHFGNPSSSHWYGAQSRQAIEQARQQLAQLLECQPEEVVFTSGGSESNNHAIKGVALVHRNRGDHIITSSVEHPAVTEVCRFLAGEGFRVTYLPVDESGRVAVEGLRRALDDRTILVTIMHANNEVGTVQPIRELARVAHEHGVLFHTDAAQSVGKITASVAELGVDLLSVAGHKFYAPKGIGALYLRSGVQVTKLIHGADHERNLRAGTENVLEIVGIGEAARIARRDLEDVSQHMQQMRDRLQDVLQRSLPQMHVNGHLRHRLPNTLSVSFPNTPATTLLERIGQYVAASAGAACHTDSVKISAVLSAMGVPTEVAMGTIRFSTGRMTTREEIDRVGAVTVDAVRQLMLAGK